MHQAENHIKTNCFHCGETCSNEKIITGNKHFCCTGCKMVYEILNESGLCDYYILNPHPGFQQNEPLRSGKFDFLDNPEVTKQLIRFTDGKQTHVNFYLPQIHCSSCLWLLENISEVNKGILSSRVNFITKEVVIVFDVEKTSLRKVVESLTLIGYEPHLSLAQLGNKKIAKLNRTRWYKIGVAGFCFSNIMMLSFPEYLLKEGTIDPAISIYFKAIILFLSIPVLVYSASEFFTSAYHAMKRGFLNIDAPVALALLLTFGRSVYEIVSNTGSGYLDSMSGIVFFMLTGRWLQDRTYNLINFDRDFKSFFPIAVHVVKEGKTVPVELHQLQEKDCIQVHANEIIPVDGILSKGNAMIDYSFVNGENNPVLVKKGEIVYAGGKQLGAIIELVVVKTVSQSYLTSLWNKEIFQPGYSNPKKRISKTLVDNVGRYFTYIVLAIATIAAIYWYSSGYPHYMWNAITTVLIVACPCALLLSENFTYSNFLRILGYNKFYLKNKSTIENLMDVDTIVLDKTGTLTHSNESVVKYVGKSFSYQEERSIASLLSQSMHTISNPILQFLNIPDIETIEDFKETEGEGIEGWVQEKHVKTGSAKFIGLEAQKEPGTTVYIKIDGLIYGKFIISNHYRKGMFKQLELLQDKYTLALVSGDNNAESAKLQNVFPKGSTILFDQKPVDKLQYVQTLQQNGASVLMIGDGLNDAGALKQSDVGIAVTDKNNVFTPSSDAILDGGKLSKLDAMLQFIRSGRKIIFATFFISAIYNVIGLYYAVQGVLSPLIAAILMPCSTITIVGITYGLSIFFAKKNKLVYAGP